MTNYQSAINVLSTARNVEHWNYIRESLKDTLKMSDLIRIDGSGLIVKVLGPDKYINYHNLG